MLVWNAFTSLPVCMYSTARSLGVRARANCSGRPGRTARPYLLQGRCDI